MAKVYLVSVCIMLLLGACGLRHQAPAGNDDPDVPNSETVDADDTPAIILFSAYRDSVYPALFEAAFADSTTLLYSDTKYHCSVKEIGLLKVESGKMVACDPINLGDMPAFTQVFPVGNFPVQLGIISEQEERQVAFARVLFSPNAVVRWQCARRPKEPDYQIGDSVMNCYGVDSGIGTFADLEASNLLDNMDETSWSKAFMNDKLLGRIYSFDGHNVASFTSGAGDGCYATYIGYDVNGQPCRLLTDFDLLDW